jgi:hypothetical protein
MGRFRRWRRCGGSGSKGFFLKKEAKTFAGLSRKRRRVRDSVAKVFWFFFAKKNGFL